MSGEKPKWRPIRVREETWQRLRAEITRKVEAAQAGQDIAVEYRPERINPGDLGVSFDAVISWLLDELTRKRRRVKEAKERKKKKK